jgi:toxin ParE1/3/4
VSVAVILRPAAETDVDQIRADLDAVQLGLGDDFASRLREVLRRIEQMPELYGVVWHDVRAVRLRRFRYVVYYVVFPDRVEVLAVLHGSRDSSSAWQSRV